MDRLVRTLNHLGLSTMGLTLLAGAALCLGMGELLTSLVGQLSPPLLQAVILNTMLFLAPLVVSLLLLLQCGPTLILRGEQALEHAQASGNPQRWWRFCAPDLLALALVSPLLVLHFLAAVLLLAALSTGGGGLQQLGFLTGSLDPLLLVRSLVRVALFTVAGGVLYCRQGSRSVLYRRALAAGTPAAEMGRLSRAIGQSAALLLGLSLLWVVLADPLELS